MDRPPQTNPLGSALQPSALVSTPLGSATPGRIPRTGPSIGSLGSAPSFGLLGSALPSLTSRLCPRGSSPLQTGPLESASSRWALSQIDPRSERYPRIGLSRIGPARNGTLGSTLSARPPFGPDSLTRPLRLALFHSAPSTGPPSPQPLGLSRSDQSTRISPCVSAPSDRPLRLGPLGINLLVSNPSTRPSRLVSLGSTPSDLPWDLPLVINPSA